MFTSFYSLLKCNYNCLAFYNLNFKYQCLNKRDLKLLEIWKVRYTCIKTFSLVSFKIVNKILKQNMIYYFSTEIFLNRDL